MRDCAQQRPPQGPKLYVAEVEVIHGGKPTWDRRWGPGAETVTMPAVMERQGASD